MYNTIKKMNKKAATVPGDLPMRLIAEFSVEIAFPLAHIITTCIQSGTYPHLYKEENVTPVPKVFPPGNLKDLRKISGLFNFSKIMDKIIDELMMNDTGPKSI